MIPKDSLILLSAGGTGGHMTPAMALSHALAARGYKTALVTDVRGAKYAPMFGDIPVHVLPSGTAFPGLMGKLKGLWDLARGTCRALGLIRKFKPAVIVGFGGYPSVPGILGGQLAGVPTILHEQNAVIGKANH
ncbi:MAG TPA: glycosyltransferase, partial [Alphaproteobacteria bacterium]|nr:glycosyltransferase [Alphaproteobacteria bacterium]